MNIHSFYNLFLPFFRRQRMKRFLYTYDPDENTRIIDIGGYAKHWESTNLKSQFTILNLTIPADTSNFKKNYQFVKGDGTALDFTDNSFDIAYSNSVIEHLESWENQVKFANEIRRIAKNIWIQTPAKWFFVDPHLMTPFIHYLPKRFQRKLIRNFTLWGIVTRAPQSYIDMHLKTLRLITYREMKTLFPDCSIYKERFLFLVKSYIAIRKTNPAD